MRADAALRLRMPRLVLALLATLGVLAPPARAVAHGLAHAREPHAARWLVAGGRDRPDPVPSVGETGAADRHASGHAGLHGGSPPVQPHAWAVPAPLHAGVGAVSVAVGGEGAPAGGDGAMGIPSHSLTTARPRAPPRA